MTLLLDTHVLLWWLADDPELSPTARARIADPEAAVYVSAVTAWEIGIKAALGRVAAPDDLADQIRAGGFTELPITVADALLAGSLPRHHDDPFDRMLIAQAQRRGLALMSRDRRLPAYEVALVEP